jgi:hypothetical protein
MNTSDIHNEPIVDKGPNIIVAFKIKSQTKLLSKPQRCIKM